MRTATGATQPSRRERASHRLCEPSVDPRADRERETATPAERSSIDRQRVAGRHRTAGIRAPCSGDGDRTPCADSKRRCVSATLQTPDGAFDTGPTIANGLSPGNVNVRFVRAFRTRSGAKRHMCLFVTASFVIYPQLLEPAGSRRVESGCGYNPGLLGTARIGGAPVPGVVVDGVRAIRAWIGLSSREQKGRDAA
jgi:hypothetical protein